MFTHSISEIDIALHLHESVLELCSSGRSELDRIPHQVRLIRHAVSVDANALTRLFGTAERHNGSREIENAECGELGDGVAAQQAGQLTANLRQVLLNIKSRRAKA